MKPHLSIADRESEHVIENSIGCYVAFCWRQWWIESFLRVFRFISFRFGVLCMHPFFSDPCFFRWRVSLQTALCAMYSPKQTPHMHACLVHDARYFFARIWHRTLIFFSLSCLCGCKLIFMTVFARTNSVSIDPFGWQGTEKEKEESRQQYSFHSQWHCRLILYWFRFAFFLSS